MPLWELEESGVISLWRLVVHSPKIVINLYWTYKNFIVMENHIGSAISTHRQPHKHPGTVIQGFIILFRWEVQNGRMRVRTCCVMIWIRKWTLILSHKNIYNPWSRQIIVFLYRVNGKVKCAIEGKCRIMMTKLYL